MRIPGGPRRPAGRAEGQCRATAAPNRSRAGHSRLPGSSSVTGRCRGDRPLAASQGASRPLPAAVSPTAVPRPAAASGSPDRPAPPLADVRLNPGQAVSVNGPRRHAQALELAGLGIHEDPDWPRRQGRSTTLVQSDPKVRRRGHAEMYVGELLDRTLRPRRSLLCSALKCRPRGAARPLVGRRCRSPSRWRRRGRASSAGRVGLHRRPVQGDGRTTPSTNWFYSMAAPTSRTARPG